jgi:hypothetical protein
MTKKEHQMCEWAANLYHDKVRECEMLKRRLEQKERENRLLRQQLGYKRAADIQNSRDDAEVFMIVKMHRDM